MTPTLLGKSTARPETRAAPKSCGTIRVVWGARPRRNRKISPNDSADDTVWVCDWSGQVHVCRADDGAGRVALAPDRERRHPARRGGRGAPVQVDVVRDPGGTRRRAGEIALRDEGAQRVRDEVDPVRAGGRQQAGDPCVEPRVHLGQDRRDVRGVVLVGLDDVDRVAVAGQPFGLGLELRGGSRAAVYEDHWAVRRCGGGFGGVWNGDGGQAGREGDPGHHGEQAPGDVCIDPPPGRTKYLHY